MSDVKGELKEDVKENMAVSNVNSYPKNIQELTEYVSPMLHITHLIHRIIRSHYSLLLIRDFSFSDVTFHEYFSL